MALCICMFICCKCRCAQLVYVSGCLWKFNNALHSSFVCRAFLVIHKSDHCILPISQLSDYKCQILHITCWKFQIPRLESQNASVAEDLIPGAVIMQPALLPKPLSLKCSLHDLSLTKLMLWKLELEWWLVVCAQISQLQFSGSSNSSCIAFHARGTCSVKSPQEQYLCESDVAGCATGLSTFPHPVTFIWWTYGTIIILLMLG